MLTSFPFGNAVVEVTYTGEELWKIFEGVVSGTNQFNGKNVTSFFQVSTGVRVEYNPDNAAGSRLVRLSVGADLSPVDNATEYTIVTVDFLTGGGDNILEPAAEVVVLDTMDAVLVNYIEAHSPIDFVLDGRIAVVGGSGGSTNGTNSTLPTGTSSSTPAPTETINVGSRSGIGSCFALLVFAVVLVAVA